MTTAEPDYLFLGFDPGGHNTFGWSVCREVNYSLECLDSGLANDARDAIDQVRELIAAYDNVHVWAAGINAPLLWNERGTRNVDDRVRHAMVVAGFPARQVGGTVQAVNGLRGACVVQGTLLARHLSEDADWDLTITESHSRAFHHLLTSTGESELSVRESIVTNGLDEHQLDATRCALAAWGAMRNLPLPQRTWQNLYEGEPTLIYPHQIPVSYWMPLPA